MRLPSITTFVADVASKPEYVLAAPREACEAVDYLSVAIRLTKIGNWPV
ncbi:MAG: hypothetical protein NXH88_19485 [Hyphomonas sp.]|nr:hypothetical protein [Hyphomonas sp.]